MRDGVEIRGGATEFEAVVIAVVLDRIEADERAATEQQSTGSPVLPAWVRTLREGQPVHPLEISGPSWRDPSRGG